MKRLKSILILFLIFLFVICIIEASAFTVVSNLTTNTVCPSSTIVIEEIVTASSAGAFTVTIEGTAATFTTTVPTGFWLEGGQVQSVYSYITPSSQVVPGNYKLKITIEKNGEIKTVEHNIIVENCHNTVLSVEPESLQVCACEENTMTLNINNMGNYLENYEIFVEGPAADWLNLSSESVTLESCTDTDVQVYVLSPCNVAGTYEVNFVVKSQSPYAQANKKAEIEVISCYDYAVSSEKIYYSMCESDELSIPIKIKNFGTRDNIYRIIMEGPSWATIDQKTLSIAKGEEKTFNIIAKPQYMTEGNFSTHIEILTDYGKVLKKYDVTIDVEKCYDVAVTIEGEEDRMCNALSNTYSVVIKNNGKFENTFDIMLEGKEWATISEKHMTLGAGEEKSIVLDIHPPYNTIGRKYEFTIKAKDPLSGAEAEDTITIETVSIKDCYMPAISTKDEVIRVARDSTATVIFIVENMGEQPAHYNLEISGTATSFSQLNPGAIDIEPGEAQTIYLYVAPPPKTQLQDYIITVTARLEDTTILASKTITITVVETEELEHIIPEEPVEEEEKSWSQKFIGWIVNLFKPKQLGEIEEERAFEEKKELEKEIPEEKENVAEEENVTEENVAEENITLGNQAPVLKEDIPDLEIAAGESYTLNLDDYFEDPDGDDLTYVTVKPLNVDVSLTGSVVKLTPKPDFEGTSEITFYASDGEKLTQSNTAKITLTKATAELEEESEEEEPEEGEPEEEEKPETVDFFTQYRGLIIAGIIVLIIIVIILTGLGKKIIGFFEEEVPINNRRR